MAKKYPSRPDVQAVMDLECMKDYLKPKLGERAPPRKVRKTADGDSEEDDDEMSLTEMDRLISSVNFMEFVKPGDFGLSPEKDAMLDMMEGITRGTKQALFGYTKISEDYGFFATLKLSENSDVYAGEQQGGSVVAARDVVIKLIKDNDRSRREVKCLHRLDFHPNIVAILHSGIYTLDLCSYIYIVMEKCHHDDLKTYMKTLKSLKIQLKEDQKLAIAKQFLRGLKFIHHNDIVNGNIKLDNVLISKDGNYVKICSFGFKRFLHPDSAIAPQSRESEDTDGNSAPETYSKKVLSKEADVFSAGLLVYSLVSNGRHAYGNDPDRWNSNIRDNINRDLSDISITEEKEMEGLLNHMLEHKPKNRPTVEATLESNIFRKVTTDLKLDLKLFKPPKSQPSEKKEERLENVFQEKIIPAFPKIEAFRKFAQAKEGLCLDEKDIQRIAENHADSVETEKMSILRRWQERLGSGATAQKIQSIVEEYKKHESRKESERLLDAFQKEVIEVFTKMEDFLDFSRSKRGLCLDEHDIQHIKEDNPSSVEAQKMQMLMKWKEINGSDATVEKILSIRKEYQKPKLESERLVDTFQDIVIKAYPKMEDFLEFARSKRGLCLDESDIQHIKEDNSGVKEQKMQLLMKWKERSGSEATVEKILSLLEEYQKFRQEFEASTSTTLPSGGRQSDQLEKLKPIFKEVTKPYTAIEELKGFAKSKSGLGLPDSGIQRITSLEGQQMQILEMWMEMLGSDATVENLRSSAERYEAEKDFIYLSNGSYGVYRKTILRDKCDVYLGDQRIGSGDQPCAVKLLRSEKNKAEAEMLVQLEQHENVVKVLHVGTYGGGISPRTFVVMELCTTQHLGDVIETTEFKEGTALSWARQIICAVVFIHKNNIVHLDIKPQNILFTQNQKSIKLADFDSSKKIRDESGLVKNPSDEGTEGYRAPEMYNHEKITQKVDIFAAGVTLAQVFSHGIHPYGTDRFLWTSNIKRNEGLNLSRTLIADKVSANSLLWRMLRPNYEERPTAPVVLADAVFRK